MCEVREYNYEEDEKYRRKNNIVLYNMKESQNTNPKDREAEDESECRKLFNESLQIGNINIVKVIRLGKREETQESESNEEAQPQADAQPQTLSLRKRPLLVKLNNEHDKWKILKNAKNLKHEQREERKNIGISKDLTKKEREQEKKLRTELKRRRDQGEQGWFIKNGVLLRAREHLPNQ